MPDSAIVIRPELLEVLARRALTEDSARPEAVAKHHARGGTTAREKIHALVDEGSFVEYGQFVTAAQSDRRELDDLLDRTVADGIVGGLATIDGDRIRLTAEGWLLLDRLAVDFAAAAGAAHDLAETGVVRTPD